MSASTIVEEPASAIHFVTKAYSHFLIVCFALIPAYLISYLFFFQDATLNYESHLFHEVAIAAATLEGLFITYVTWRCYQSSGEPLLRWLTLGFLGFVLIYALHGALTRLAHDHMWLFLLYGPVSRLVMSILLLVGLLSFDREADSVEIRRKPRSWLGWVSAFILIDLLVAVVANSHMAGHVAVRLSIEGGALFFSALNVAALIIRRIRSPLMLIFGISVTAFALSSVAFILGRPWNHMWWLAHAIFAGGFFLLSYGVVQAFHTTRSFATIYSQEELMARLKAAMASTEGALQELQRTNQKLEHLAATDPLTGVANRHAFFQRIEAEIARANRESEPFSLLALDLDHFKQINDYYGHQIGDKVLQEVVQQCCDAIRPYDGVARVGGEEFMVLLPKAALAFAYSIGERIRSAIESTVFESVVGRKIGVTLTVSIGVSQFGRDGKSIDAILRAADDRLYRAKAGGRNRVVAM